ncbi:hypothetical protein LMG7974_01655 [Campylobacter majalis]|uniref:IraD/Gp25-like domain-containing protein n=1 Tax=Campylobacter majalis TaxID=2790656 RepID=A0ABN7KAM5_9BACT|nr:GPW/gp25 family protein [Campylobacter majalis]CAD7289578.1 hypothetical protein LMG7974_01655 [Campylobacter majalis]
MYQISIKENLRRIFVTNKYTKTLRPLFGLDTHIDKRGDLYNLLALKNDILQQIQMHEPRIKPTQITFTQDEQGVNLTIAYNADNAISFLKINI